MNFNLQEAPASLKMPTRWPIGLLDGHVARHLPFCRRNLVRECAPARARISRATRQHYGGVIMLSLIGTIIVGGIIGLIARAIKPGDDSMGWIMTIVLGIAGSLVAGYLGRALGWYHEGQAAGWIASVVGAIVLLFVWGLVARRRA
jgi:uncharacterized membrane protein YeaQ/YmgE (transglycosylase-associated protein family)